MCTLEWPQLSVPLFVLTLQTEILQGGDALVEGCRNRQGCPGLAGGTQMPQQLNPWVICICKEEERWYLSAQVVPPSFPQIICKTEAFPLMPCSSGRGSPNHDLIRACGSCFAACKHTSGTRVCCGGKKRGFGYLLFPSSPAPGSCCRQRCCWGSPLGEEPCGATSLMLGVMNAANGK